MNKNSLDVSCDFFKTREIFLPLVKEAPELKAFPAYMFIRHDLLTHLRMGIPFTEEGEEIADKVKPNVNFSFIQKLCKHIRSLDEGLYNISLFSRRHKGLRYNIEYIGR